MRATTRFHPAPWTRLAGRALVGVAITVPAFAQDLLVGGPDTQIRSGDPALGEFQVVGVCGGIVDSMASIGTTTYIGDESGILYVHDTASGLGYVFDAGNDATALAVHGGELYVAGSDASIERYDLATHAQTGTLTAAIPIHAMVVVGDELFVAGHQGIVLHADLAGSATFAFFAAVAGAIDSLAADDSALIAGTSGGVVHRIDFATATISGSFTVSGDASAMGMHLGDLLVADSQGHVQRMDATTGVVHDVMVVGSAVTALSTTAFTPPGSTYCYGELCPCQNSDPLAGCANSTGQGAFLRATGTSSVAADDLTLFVTQAPGSQFGIFFMGNQPGWSWIGAGELCTGGPYFRFPVAQLESTGFHVQTGFGAHASQNHPPGGQLMIGSTWTFQFWYRDPTGPCGSAYNVSNGYIVTFTP